MGGHTRMFFVKILAANAGLVGAYFAALVYLDTILRVVVSSTIRIRCYLRHLWMTIGWESS